jgi:RNA polymerase sigma factor (sigma-70 family)
MLNIENHLDLIRKIAWSYVKGNPGLEFDDLFSEACLACLEAKDTFNPERGKESTFIWAVVKNALINLCASPTEIVDKRWTSCIDKMYPSPEEQLIAEEEWGYILNTLSPKSKQICSLVLDRTSPYLPTDKPKTCRGIIIKELRKRGWAWPEIWKSFREIKQVLSLQS